MNAGPRLLTTVPLAAMPVAAAIDTARDRVIVSDYGHLTTLDGRSGAVLRTANIPTFGPMVVSARTGRIFAGTAAGIQVWTPGGRLLRTVPGGKGLIGMAVDEKRRHVFIATSTDSTGLSCGTGSVMMLDAATGALLHTVATGLPPSPACIPYFPGQRGTLALDAATGRLFVPSWRVCAALPPCTTGGQTAGSPSFATDRLVMIDTAHGTVLRTIATHGSVDTYLLDSATRRIFVGGDAGITVLDSSTGAILHTWHSLHGTALVAADWRTGAIEQLAETGRQSILRALDGHTGAVLRRVPLASPPIEKTTVALDPRSRRLFALESSPDRSGRGILRVFDADSGEQIDRVAVGGQPAAMLLDGRTDHLFVVNQGAGATAAAAGPPGHLPWWRSLSERLRWALRAPAPDIATSSVSVVDAAR